MIKNATALLLIALLCSCASLSDKNPLIADIAIDEVGGRPYIWATLNGNRYQFLLDTGATDFLLTDKMIQESGLTYSNTNTMKATGITGDAHLKTVSKVTLMLDNGIVLNISDVAVIENNNHSLFPYKFFKAVNATWDFKNNKLTFNNDKR